MPFQNPIVAGTALVRAAIHSPDYSPGVSGWSINRDGTAEFSDAVIRGEIVVGNPGDEQIIISPNAGSGFPEIRFRSADGTKEGFINAAPSGGSPDKSWIGINSSPYLSVDGVTRTARAWLLGDSARFEVIKSSTQEIDGGYVVAGRTETVLGVERPGAVNGPYIWMFDDNRIHLASNIAAGGYAQLLQTQAFLGVGTGNRVIVNPTNIQIVSEDGDVQFFTNSAGDSTKIKRDGESLLLPVNSRKFNGAITASISTAPGVYVDIPGYSVVIDKKYNDTLLAIDMHMGGFLSPGAAGTIFAGVRINGVDYDVLEHQINVGSQFHMVSGTQDTGLGPAIGAGLVTVQARWKGTFAGATYNTGGIRCSLKVTEINP